jgi:hypothetical protein
MELERKSKEWRLLQSWWIVLSFIPLLPWLPFLYIAARTKKNSWAVWSLVYAIPNFIFFFTDYPYESSAYDMVLAASMMSTVVAIIHSFVIRKDYLNRLEYKSEYGTELRTEREITSGETASLSSSREIPNFREVPNAAIPLQNHQHGNKEKGGGNSNGPLNINLATEEELADLPGIGILLSKKAIYHRQRNGQFNTLGEFFELLQLKDYEIHRLVPLLTV